MCLLVWIISFNIYYTDNVYYNKFKKIYKLFVNKILRVIMYSNVASLNKITTGRKSKYFARNKKDVYTKPP